MPDDLVHVRLESEDFPCDDLQIFELKGRESISLPFVFTIGAATTKEQGLDCQAALGATATLIFEVLGREVRRIHGMVAGIDDLLDTEPNTRSYQLLLVPRAQRLAFVTTQEIFMDLSVPEILKKKIENVGLSTDDLDMRLLQNYPKLEYVVQYKETDLAFVSRLAENVGISFYFDHEGAADKIVFADHNASFPVIHGRETASFRARGEKRDVYRVESQSRLVPRTHVVHDYNYRNAMLNPMGSAEAPSGLFGGVVEYGAHCKTPDEAENLARIRAEETEARHKTYLLESDLAWFSAGCRFTLEGHPKLGDTKLLITEIEHAGRFPISLFGGKAHIPYTNTFRALDESIPFRPARVTPKPKIFGVINGVIAHEQEGTESKFARIDEYGRYLVRMMFDTAETGDRKVVSRRMRMAQPHAGANYGHHFPLKPGIEVLIGFVDGDPDRPLILGAAYNSITPSPVVAKIAPTHRMKTATGILIEMKDA